MIFYLIHYLPHHNLEKPAKRNMMTLIYGLVVYLIIYIYLKTKNLDNNPILKMVRDYFQYIFLIDIVAMTILYKYDCGKIIKPPKPKLPLSEKVNMEFTKKIYETRNPYQYRYNIQQT